ncbi:transcriptional regulator domain-containing protein [Novosphingobium sp. 11B]
MRPRVFAWEVLRRRADYCVAAPARKREVIREGKIEVIVDSTATANWGLRFRGSSRPGRRRRPADVGPRTRSTDHTIDGASM